MGTAVGRCRGAGRQRSKTLSRLEVLYSATDSAKVKTPEIPLRCPVSEDE